MSDFPTLLINWYRKNKRLLPWRGEKDPYKIWLSEVMLQQTQVETVIPFYKNWIQRFPDISSVAEASQDEVLKYWEGLGYYSRCRNFHRACQIVVNNYSGKIPNQLEDFRKLPGVGDYTAAAVLSFAFGKSTPVIDGNVSRVMSRLVKFSEPVEKGRTVFRKQLEEWIDPENPGEFNQAIMELGSLVCRRNQPHCIKCPVIDFCAGYKSGSPGKYPMKVSRSPIPHKTMAAAVIWNNSKFFIQKRPSNSLLGGLWELPGVEVTNKKSKEHQLVKDIKKCIGFEIQPATKIGFVQHAYSHFKVTLHGYHCRLINNNLLKNPTKKHGWISPDGISHYPFPRVNHKLFEILQGQNWEQ